MATMVGLWKCELKKLILLFALNLSRVVCILSYFKRVLTNFNKIRPDMPEGCPEKFDFEFMKYIWNFPKASGLRNLERLRENNDKKVIVFNKRSEVNKFIGGILKKKNEV